MTALQADEYDRLSVTADAGRFLLQLDGDTVGWAVTSVADGVLTIAHVETALRHRGKDFAARLMHGVLDAARAQSLRVRPRCGYAADYMRHRPATHDLLT